MQFSLFKPISLELDNILFCKLSYKIIFSSNKMTIVGSSADTDSDNMILISVSEESSIKFLIEEF